MKEEIIKFYKPKVNRNFRLSVLFLFSVFIFVFLETGIGYLVFCFSMFSCIFFRFFVLFNEMAEWVYLSSGCDLWHGIFHEYGPLGMKIDRTKKEILEWKPKMQKTLFAKQNLA